MASHERSHSLDGSQTRRREQAEKQVGQVEIASKQSTAFAYKLNFFVSAVIVVVAAAVQPVGGSTSAVLRGSQSQSSLHVSDLSLDSNQ